MTQTVAVSDTMRNGTMSEELPHVVRTLPLDALFVDHTYARPTDSKWVDYITNHFTPSKVQLLAVSKRPNGVYALLDGQHRKHALIQAGYTEWACIVYGESVPLTIAQEADLYAGLNHGLSQNVRDQWRARLAANDPMLIAIKRIVEDRGLRLAISGENSPHGGWVQPLRTLELIYDRLGSEILSESLFVLTAAFGKNIMGLTRQAIEGTAAFLIRYNSHVNYDRPRLINRMTTTGINELYAIASDQRRANGGDLPSAFGRALLRTYNSHLREYNQLPQWQAKVKAHKVKRLVFGGS